MEKIPSFSLGPNSSNTKFLKKNEFRYLYQFICMKIRPDAIN